MKDIIESIVEQAKECRKEGMSDFDIARFVHFKLGKELYYDNNYTAKLNSDVKTDETEQSQNRKRKLLEKKTDKSSKVQICKGMAEIYAEILNKLDIKANAIGPLKKGETDIENKDNRGEHYCTVFEIEGQKYVQDFLIEAALVRIRIGEAERAEKTPGICLIEEYKKRSEISLGKIELFQTYIEETFSNQDEIIDIDSIVRLVFQELYNHCNKSESIWGFEETKNYVIPAINGLIRMKSKNGIAIDLKKTYILNLIKETESQCEVACIYVLNEKKYLIRSEDKISDIDIPIGEISDEDLYVILNQGYVGRSQSGREKCNEFIQNHENNMARRNLFDSAILTPQEMTRYSDEINDATKTIKSDKENTCYLSSEDSKNR